MDLQSRKAGILLHPTSLPGGEYNGELGEEAFHFVDFLTECGIKVWQVLPLGPTLDDKSPYQCLSAHAGEPRLISFSKLCAKQWLNVNEYGAYVEKENKTYHDKQAQLTFSFLQFSEKADENDKQAYLSFKNQHGNWLDDYALFCVLREKFDHRSWTDWPVELRDRVVSSLTDVQEKYEGEIELVRFTQFIFFQQWMAIKHYANDKGISIFGDLPLFVAHDSADVWSNRKMFKLDKAGHTTVVAGVPPDYFSATGQRWGNPVFDWDNIESDDFSWWVSRLKSQVELFDLIRIDHFRGLEAYWEIPATDETALNGVWVPGPKEKFFEAINRHFNNGITLVAEDLGLITDEVHALRENFTLPGMKILQFAFDEYHDGSNPYLPHNHESLSVVYTGTHDNDTTLGWFNSLNDHMKAQVYSYFGETQETMPWMFVRAAFASVACLAVIPMQDILELDGSHRMNTPGTTEGNWRWRFQWQQVDRSSIASRLQSYSNLYQR